MSEWLRRKKEYFQEYSRKEIKMREERLILIKKEEEKCYYELHRLITEIFNGTNVKVEYINDKSIIKAEDLAEFRVKDLNKQMKLLKDRFSKTEEWGWIRLDENSLARYLLKYIQV